jgi:hypothetical protein
MNEIVPARGEGRYLCDDRIDMTEGRFIVAFVSNESRPDIHVRAEVCRAENRANIIKIHVEQQEQTTLHQRLDLPLDRTDFADHPQRGGAKRNVIGGLQSAHPVYGYSALALTGDPVTVRLRGCRVCFDDSLFCAGDLECPAFWAVIPLPVARCRRGFSRFFAKRTHRFHRSPPNPKAVASGAPACEAGVRTQSGTGRDASASAPARALAVPTACGGKPARVRL